MHRFTRILATTLLLAVALPLGAPTALAEEAAAKDRVERRPMLWVVGGKPRIYLFGTIHVNDPRVLAHPAAVRKALDDSGALYVVDWETSEGHVYNLVLRDGASEQPAASVRVHEYQGRGRFAFVGYRVE